MLPDLDWLARPAFDQVVQVTVVAIVVAVLVRLFGRTRPHLAYLLWMLVIVKCLTPPLFSSPTSLFSWAMAEERAPMRISTSSEVRPAYINFFRPDGTVEKVSTELLTDAQNPTAPEENGPTPWTLSTWSTIALLIWIVGATLFALYVAVKWIRLRRAVRASKVDVPDWAHELLRQLVRRLEVRRVPELMVSSAQLGPWTLGWPRSVIVVPVSLGDRSREVQLETILAHELMHIRRGDLPLGLVQLAAQIAWWFHPLVWWANREARRERERCCDESVLARLPLSPKSYAATLVEVLELRHRLAMSAMLPVVSASDLNERRLRHILRPATAFRARTPRWCWGVALIAALLALPGAGLSLEAQVAETQVAVAQVTETQATETKVTGVFVPAEANLEPAAKDSFSEQHQKAADRLRELGATITEGFDPTSKRQFTYVNFDKSWQGQAADLRLIDDLEGLYRVSFFNCPPTIYAGMRDSQALRQVESLMLDCPTPEAMHALEACTQLKSLFIVCSDREAPAKIQPADFASFAKLQNLRSLHLSNIGADDSVLQVVGELAKLLELTLENVPISDQGIAHLAALDKLHYLLFVSDPRDDAPSPGITGSGLAALAKLPRLSSLMLVAPSITDAGMQAIGELGNLKFLSVNNARQVTSDGLKPLAALNRLQVLNLSGPSVAGDELAPLADMTDLERLILGDEIELRDAGAAHVSKLSKLRTLHTTGAGLTDQGIAQLANLRGLHYLHIPLAQVTPAGLEQLVQLPKLSSLQFDAKQIDDRVLEQLLKFPRLTTVPLSNSQVTDDGLAAIEQREDLLNVDLSHTSITDRGVAHLAKLSKLKDLNLRGTKITDASLEILLGLKSLRFLDLSETSVSESAVKNLHAALPDMQLSSSLDRANSVTRFELFGLTTDEDLQFDGVVLPEDEGSTVDPLDESPEVKPADIKEEGRAVEPPGESSNTSAAFSERHQTAAARLRELGASVKERVSNDGDDRQVSVALGEDWRGTPDDQRLIGELDTVTTFWHGPVYEQGKAPDLVPGFVELLERFKELTTLQLVNATPADLEKIGTFLRLKILILDAHTDRLPVTGDDLAPISQLTALRNLLLLGNIDLGDTGARHVAPLRNLLQLEAPGRGLTDEGIASLASMTQLRSLRISETEVTSAGLEKLAGLPSCMVVLLDTKVARDGVEQLARTKPKLKRRFALTDGNRKKVDGKTTIRILSLLVEPDVETPLPAADTMPQ